MTPRRAALQYAAALIERQLAAAHPDRTDDRPAVRERHRAEEPTERMTADWWAWWNRRPGQPILALDTFEHAPPHIAAALKDGRLDGDAVAKEMAALADELRGIG